MSQQPEPFQKRRTLRVLMAAMPVVLIVASFTLLTLSPTVWASEESRVEPPWLPVLSAAIMGLVGGVVGLYALREVLRRTLGDFEVFGLQVYFGVLAFPVGALIQFNYIPVLNFIMQTTENDPLDQSGTGILAFSLLTLGGCFLLGIVWCGAYVFAQAITNHRPNMLSQRGPNEIDGIGELLKERH